MGPFYFTTFKQNIYLVCIIFISFSCFSQSYLGTVTNQVNFRIGPGSNYEIISQLKPGNQVFILSVETEDDFYNVIDIKSDVEGFVHKSFIKTGKLIPKSDGGFISATGNTLNNDSEAKIFNDTNITMTLKLNSVVYKFSPKETKNITLTPGSYEFRASAPGVLPRLGTKFFENNMGYSWKFFIITQKR